MMNCSWSVPIGDCSVYGAVGELVAIFDGDIRGDTTEERNETRSSRVTKIPIGVENVFEALQQGVVIERRIGSGAGLEKRREQHGAGTIAAVTLEAEDYAGSDCGGLRKRSKIWPGLLIAAEFGLAH